MSTRTYNFGFQLGTAMRECIRAISSPSKTTTIKLSATAPEPYAPPPAPTLKQFDDLCRNPAFVRNKGVDLSTWFAANVHECKPEPKKPRARKQRQGKSVAPAEAAPTEKSNGQAFGSLNELIA